MKIINATQGSPEWLAHRANCFNASDAPAMLGCSPHKARAELLREAATGIAQEHDAAAERRFADGHRFEALARPLAEKIIGDELYPITGAIDMPPFSRALGASFDGLTLMNDTGFEHKTLNDDLRACMKDQGNGYDLPKHYQVQMEQQLLVSGAERVLFMATRWEGDTCIEQRHCWYASDPKLRAELTAGWKQFDADLAAYQPVEVLDRAAPVGHGPDQLPALRVQASGALVLESNLKEWEAAALAFIQNVRSHELKTDEDFANADAAAKWCDSSKTTLQGVKANLMGATGDVQLAVSTIDRIIKELDGTRIAFTNAGKARKDARKGEIVADGVAKLKSHIDALNARLGKPYMPAIAANFGGCISGLKSLASMENKVHAELTRAKLEANEHADRIDANLKHLREHAEAYKALFPDTATIVLKAPDDLQALVASRIAQHQQAEQKKADDLREQIERETREKLAREQQEREATEARQRQEQEARERRQREADEAAQRTIAAPPPAATPSGMLASPAPAAAPANVVTMQPRAAAPTPSPATPPTLSLGAIKERLAPVGLSTDAAGLALLGFKPAATQGAARLFHERDWPLMLAAMVSGLEAIQAKQAA